MKNFLLSLSALIILFGCSSSDTSPDDPTLPEINTAAVTNISQTTATTGGTVTSEGESEILAKGIVWGTNINPTLTDNLAPDLSGQTIFTLELSGLAANTTYHVRAFATNSSGTGYGDDVSFTTSSVGTLPTLTTTAATGITQTGATSGGNISTDGGSPVTARGVVYATTQNPTLINTVTVNGSGTGSFVSAISALSPSTTYYIRAYATNINGTAYGNQITITTAAGTGSLTVTDIDGNIYQTIELCSKRWMQSNLNVSKYRNGDQIPQVQDPAAWAALTTGAWCYYENNTANGTSYGKLYNWYAVKDSRGLAPAGYHIPTEDEYDALAMCLGGWGGAGNKMKETGTIHWIAPNSGSTNSSGWTARGGGNRFVEFDRLREDGNWWTITEVEPGVSNSDVYSKVLTSGVIYLGTDQSPKYAGFSVRCIKD